MAICASCGKENPDGFAFCGYCTAPLAELPSPALEERKVVSVLFCDLVGFTAASEQQDPEDVRARLRPYHARLRRELERYGATVEKFVGDAVMAVCGAPVAHEDDAERAVHAGLRILDAMAELNEADPDLDLQVRVGIDTGEAVVARGARPERGEGIVTGDVVNTAARIQSAAPVNGVAVGEQTYRATSRVFEYEPLTPVSVKGKAEPLPLWQAKAARARLGSDVSLQHATPLVGRELEKPLLIGAFERAVQQRSVQLVTVVVEPGVGKSRLVAELLAYVDAKPELTRWRQAARRDGADGARRGRPRARGAARRGPRAGPSAPRACRLRRPCSARRAQGRPRRRRDHLRRGGSALGGVRQRAGTGPRPARPGTLPPRARPA